MGSPKRLRIRHGHADALLIALVCAVTLVCAGAAQPAATQNLSWRLLQPGVEYASVTAGMMTSGKPGQLHIVRIDAARATLAVALASETKTQPRTAAEWCKTADLAVAINAGMFQTDHRSNVGYLRHGKHINNRGWNSYQAVFAVNPLDRIRPRVLWVDRDQSSSTQQFDAYNIVVQNLRLITKNRRNVWSQNDRRWSEAALGVDSQERLLFIFTRAPHAMRDFNNLLLKLPLDIAGAMHLEGGPEASLSIHAAGIDLDLAGSFETGFWPDDSNERQWPIPNVLGVLREKSMLERAP